MGLVLSQLSNRRNQDMPSTRSKAKTEDGNTASDPLIERRVRGRKPVTKKITPLVPTTNNKGNIHVIAVIIPALFIHDNGNGFSGIYTSMTILFITFSFLSI